MRVVAIRTYEKLCFRKSEITDAHGGSTDALSLGFDNTRHK